MVRQLAEIVQIEKKKSFKISNPHLTMKVEILEQIWQNDRHKARVGVHDSSHCYGNSCVIWDNTVLPATRERRRYCHNPSRSRYSIHHPIECSRLSQPYARRGRAKGRGQDRTWTLRMSARNVRSERLNHSTTVQHGMV